jgi:protein SCO1/2
MRAGSAGGLVTVQDVRAESAAPRWSQPAGFFEMGSRHLQVVLVAGVLAGGIAGGCTQTWKPTAHSSTPTARTSLFSYPWVWLDDRGEHIAFSQWRGTPVVVAAIYTSCRETCPRTLARLREVYEQFGRDKRRAEFVVVTIDPETDTPERLRELRRSRDLPVTWHLLTGGSDETKQLANLLGVHVMQMEAHVVHDSKIMLFDGDGQSTVELDIF